MLFGNVRWHEIRLCEVLLQGGETIVEKSKLIALVHGRILMKNVNVKMLFEKYIQTSKKMRKQRLRALLIFVVAYFALSESICYIVDSFTSFDEAWILQKTVEDFLAYLPTALTLIINAVLSWEKKESDGLWPAVVHSIGALACLPALFVHWLQTLWSKYGTVFGLLLMLGGLCLSKEENTGIKQEKSTIQTASNAVKNALKISRNWTRNHLTSWWLWLVCTMLFLFVVQLLFSIPAPCKLLDAVWEAGDFISLVGALVLGYVAVYQTKRSNDMSGCLMEIEDTRHRLERQPFFMVVEFKARELSWTEIESFPTQLYIAIGDTGAQDNIVGIELILQNTTESFLTAMYTGSHFAVNQSDRKIYIQSGENKPIVFYADKNVIFALEGQRIRFEFALENRFGERYLETFEMLITCLSDKPPHNSGELFCSMFIQDYTIEKA